MKRYLLDSNIIISIWNKDEKLMDKILKENKIVILKEVLNELVVKETKEYRRREVLSERFCKLLPYSFNIEYENLSGFYMIFDYEIKPKFKNNNLSRNDLMELYTCYVEKDLVLVTEDKQLYDIARFVLGKNRVMEINTLLNEIIY